MHPIAYHWALAALLASPGICGLPHGSHPGAPRNVEEPRAAEPESATAREARALLDLAKAARATGDRAVARDRAAEAVQVLVAMEPWSLKTPENRLLFELGILLQSLGDLPTARVALERDVAERARRLDPDHPALLSARQNLAANLLALGELSEARDLFAAVLAAREKALNPDDTDLAKARSNLAVTLSKLGDLHGARALQEQVVEVMERTLPDEDDALATARSNLAATVLLLGDVFAARSLQERVLEVRERILPADHRDLAAARSNLAVSLSALGDETAARVLQEQALEVYERTLPPDDRDLASARANLADTLQGLGQFAAARAVREHVLEVRERTLPAGHPALAEARADLASSLKALGEIAAAEVLEKQVLEERERSLPTDHPHLAAARQNYANTLAERGDRAGARVLQEQVLAAFERTLPADHGDVSVARRALLRTIAGIRAQARDTDTAADAESKSAWIALARDYVRGLQRQVRSAVLAGSQREVEQRLTALNIDLSRTASMLQGYGVAEGDADLVRDAFLLDESCRAGAKIAARLRARAGDGAAARRLRERLATASAELARLAQSGGTAVELGQAQAAIDRAGAELARHASAVLGGSYLLEPSLPELAAQLGPKDAFVAFRRTTISSIPRDDPNTWTRVDSLVAFVLRPGAGTSASGADESRDPRLEFVDLGPFAPVEAAIERWRTQIGASEERGLASADPADALPDPGEAVRAVVLDPLRVALTGVDRIVVALDDVLHAIPLDALPAGQVWDAQSGTTKLMGDVCRFEVRTSLSEAGFDELPRKGPSALLAIGHPSFDAAAADDPDRAEGIGTLLAVATRSGADAGLLRGGAWERSFGTLPETRAEVRGIAEYFADSFGEGAEAVVLERNKASRDGLVQRAADARWLHVATHGWFAPQSVRSSADETAESPDALGTRAGRLETVQGMSPMLLCGLALAGANLPMNSIGRIPGLVTAQEIAALDLSNCELAVLSACDTNVGVRRAGQGVASLQLALSMAGARSVITSLWKVPDEATKDLMIDFYRRLWVEKKPKHQALWEAKSKLRAAQDERGRPRYVTRDWAAWVLTGEPD